MISKNTAREIFGEVLGTAILILFGDGVVASVVLFNNGNYESITWGWGIAVVLGIFASSKLSGAHLNPAVTIALYVRREFPLKKTFVYIMAQTAGAFLGALIIYFNYSEAIQNYESINQVWRNEATGIQTAGIFTTFPAPFVSHFGAIFDQILGTFLLVFGIFIITDEKNKILDHKFEPFLVGMLVVGIGMSFGGNAGYAINPARDFGPRLFVYLAGWKNIFTTNNYYFYIPIIGPIIGGVLAGLFYQIIYLHYLEDKE
jgi:MIP family channel proteins